MPTISNDSSVALFTLMSFRFKFIHGIREQSCTRITNENNSAKISFISITRIFDVENTIIKFN